MDRQERRYRTSKVVLRRMWVAKYVGMLGLCKWPHPPEPCENCFKRIQRLRGRCKKTAPCDCGHAKCFCCHHEKVLSIPTIKEVRAEISYYEQIEDLSV